MSKVSIVALAMLAGAVVQAHPQYNNRSPNGNVESGHLNGAYTPFANDQASNLDWMDLCPMDSDADGLSNGQEMGDPCCVWTPNATPAYTTGLSNPGDPADAAINTVPACPTVVVPPVGGVPPVTPVFGVPLYTTNGFQDPALTNGATCASAEFTAAKCIQNTRLGWSDLTKLGCKKAGDCLQSECCTNAPLPSCASLPGGSCAIGYQVTAAGSTKRCTTDPCIVQECCEKTSVKVDACSQYTCFNCLAKGFACSWCNNNDGGNGCYSNLSMCEQTNSVPITMTNQASCASIDGSSAPNDVGNSLLPGTDPTDPNVRYSAAAGVVAGVASLLSLALLLF